MMVSGKTPQQENNVNVTLKEVIKKIKDLNFKTLPFETNEARYLLRKI